MPVKENHRRLLRKIRSIFDAPSLYEAEFDRCEHTDKGHGREEVRRLCCTYDVPRKFTGFAGVRQVYRLEREVTHKKSGNRYVEVSYGMTSLPRSGADASELGRLIRGHWTIEGKVHYVRDVTMGEDASTVHVGNVAQVMVALRNTTLSLLRTEGYKNIAAARRYFAANPRQAIRLIGCVT